MVTQQLEKAMEGLVVLIADSNPYTRRLTRMMLTNLGIKSTYEAATASPRLTPSATSIRTS